MPFALEGARCVTVVEAHGLAHRIIFEMDPVRREPKVLREISGSRVQKRHPDHRALPKFSLLGAGGGGVPICTNRRGLHDLQPAPEPFRPVEQPRGRKDIRHRPRLAEMAGVRRHQHNICDHWFCQQNLSRLRGSRSPRPACSRPPATAHFEFLAKPLISNSNNQSRGGRSANAQVHALALHNSPRTINS
jgi:hypothetical protein